MRTAHMLPLQSFLKAVECLVGPHTNNLIEILDIDSPLLRLMHIIVDFLLYLGSVGLLPFALSVFLGGLLCLVVLTVQQIGHPVHVYFQEADLDDTARFLPSTLAIFKTLVNPVYHTLDNA